MKKSTNKIRKIQINLGLKKARHNRERKLIRKKIRHNNLSLKIRDSRSRKFIKSPKSSVHNEYNAPEVFSLLDDPEVVIDYFEEARKSLQEGIPVKYNLENIKRMGPETLIYLCALVNEDTYTQRTALQGNTPNDPELKKMFAKAKFYNFVKSPFTSKKYEEDIFDGMIHKVTRRKVESELAGEVVKSAIMHTFGIDEVKSQPSFQILIECMSNSWNHASLDRSIEEYNWWLLAYKESESKITKFCFLDLGIGIFDSLDAKFDANALGAFIRFFVPKNHKDTLNKIIGGDKQTSTMLPERGRGINNIFRLASSNPTISNFTMLSNDVFARVGYNIPAEITYLSSAFGGTIYYWELIPRNV